MLRYSRSFTVIEVGTNRKQLCDILLVINSNWQLVPFRGYCSLLFNFWTLCVFETPLGGGAYRENVRYSSWAHWKARSRLPISVNWTSFARCYGWGATSENRSQNGDFSPMGSVWPKILGGRGRPLPITFARIVRQINALQLGRWQFSQKILCGRLSSREVPFYTENGRFAFLSPYGV